MKWDDFIRLHGEMPVILSENLRIQHRGDTGLFVQLSRWKKAGRLMALKKGVFLIAPPYGRAPVFEPFLAQALLSPSYVSLEKALEHHSLIPEGVPVITSVTTKTPRRVETRVGTFRYQRLHPRLFWGYEAVTHNGQTGFIAQPEKALLDLLYLRKAPPSRAFFDGLRLGNLERLNMTRLTAFAKRFDAPGFKTKADALINFLRAERGRETPL